MDIQTKLKEIGLGKNEIEVYLSLLHYGEGTVSNIAKHCSTHRVNIYDAARQLVQKGLVTELQQENISVFKANNPEHLLSYIQVQEADIRSLIPELKQQYQQHHDNAQTYYGVQGIKHILLDMIDKGQFIYAFGITKDVPEKLQKFLETFHRNRIKHNIHIQHIYNDNAQERIQYLNTIKYSEARYLAKEMNVPATTIIYGDNVAFWIFGDEIFSVLIRSKNMALAYKKYFDFLWEISQK